MKEIFKRLFFAYRYRKAVKKAISFAKMTKLKYFVISLNGRPVVISKKDIRLLITRHRFRKGIKTADIEKRALFITNN